MTAAVDAAQTIVVRRACVEDRDALMAFYRRHHAQRSRLTDPVLWHWTFAEQPRAQERFPFYVLEANGAIVGGIGYWRARVRVDDADMDAALPVNFFIDSAYRGLPALRLLRAVLSECPVAISAYVSPDVIKLLTKSGFTDLSDQYRNYFYGLALASYAPRALVVWVVRRAAEIARRCRAALVRSSITYRESASLDDDFVHAVSLSRRPGQALYKDAAWLRWRYLKTPQLRSRFLYQLRAGIPIGMAVTAVDAARNEMLLLDCWTAGESIDELTDLIDRVISSARAVNCDMVVTHALSDTLTGALRRCLFSQTRSSLGLLVWAQNPALRARLSEPRRWHFMVGDCDAY